MKKYSSSFKMLLIAVLALLITLTWQDLGSLGFLVFLIFTFLSAQKAFEASKTFGSRVKLLAVFSALLALLVLLGFTIMNPPQCPYIYTQQQVDAAHGSCIVGANIGIGLYFMFIVAPAALFVFFLWIRTLLSARKHPQKL
jgi:hypothetical protein